MIHKVVIQNFKKFEHLEFTLLDHLVIAGPNSSGKTTLLQAIVSWAELALQWALSAKVSINNEEMVKPFRAEAHGNRISKGT